MISVDEALKTILEAIHPLGCENVPITSALGCVIGEDIVSGRNIPPLANSAMDGYAVIAADTAFANKGKPAVLDVLEDVPAGRVATQPIRKGQAIRIMTGAPLPEGADAVVRVEDTEAQGGRVKIFVAAASRPRHPGGRRGREDGRARHSQGKRSSRSRDRHACRPGPLLRERAPAARRGRHLHGR